MAKIIPDNTANGILFAPGTEPAAIRSRLDRLFEKLNAAYPDKVIVGLYKDHKKWGEAITELYRQLGYQDANTFLAAYGYTVKKGASGRPKSTDPMSIIAQLKTLYPNGTTMSVGDLQKAHPDFPWKTLQIKSNEYFGMTFSKYLAKEGILIAEKATSLSSKNGENGVAELIKVLKQRYEGKPKPADLKTLIAKNPDLPLTNLNKVVRTLFGTTAGAYLTQAGILPCSNSPSEEDMISDVSALNCGCGLTWRYLYTTLIPGKSSSRFPKRTAIQQSTRLQKQILRTRKPASGRSLRVSARIYSNISCLEGPICPLIGHSYIFPIPC